MHRIAIVGAGASGLMAAAAASRMRPHSALLLEKEARVGRKLLATGNGRCNLANRLAGPERFHGGGVPVVCGLLSRMPPEAVLRRFADIGLGVREEAEGRIYPLSGQASAVLDVLRGACGRQGVATRCDAEVTRIEPQANGFRLAIAQGETVWADKVIVAAGGKAAPAFGADGQAARLLSQLGHPIVPMMPALAPLKVPAGRIRGLKGVRARCALTLYVDGHAAQSETGEVIFGDDAVSGVAAMQLARQAGEALAGGGGVQLSIALVSREQAKGQTRMRAALFAGEAMEDFCTGLLHRRIGLCLLREAGIDTRAAASPETARGLERLLWDWRLPVNGVKPFAQAQVTAGGAALSAFDPDTLESKIVPGLFACGEALDVDGDCGGYNLLWAWLSGIAAGEAAAASVPDRGEWA